ncbi:DNA polymerase III subunit delta [Salegentibacter mishustinae]|jgi:DNA polymerase-3 subunit delta|uniref:DNA polymerase III subunit delta n=1 Tax=Salegentibacter mishustinae TaxID=270918 RepID=A0A0Q9Z5W0_9FLAO|nr:DNA polymerase III subunit delta [Salegentibacter mishustinae]KRG28333.1 DNA polymerase III subunit delta [Salegentibacter mishustinae]PNW22268.1 DNA polymerase III subunit delta [Salegentibacter mishustinae]PZX67489.1 DNA polymerase III delta subunit [Salegentibacter mishustinae]GGW79389.1 DNA polymerase III subunit delta [Salegentibacter mishustinae]
MEEAKEIVNNIQKGSVSPLYFLMGEEPYYIDRISDFIAQNLLAEEEKGFNQIIMYGRDTSIDEIVSNAKRYPMMAERQVIIVKEAQDLSRSIEKLVDYAENPQPTTTLVFCYKYKSLDKRKKLSKVLKKSGILFESKRLYENQVADWIMKTLKARNYTISPKAAQMLVEFLGIDLGKIDNELNKLQLITPEGTQITPELIEQNIGISKDFNNFELRKAIGMRDSLKAHRIVNYFAQNPKDNPMVVTISLLFSYFSQIMQYHGLPDKSKANVAKQLKVHPYFVGDYVVAAKNYPMKKVSQVIGLLHESDVKGKGVGAVNISHGDLLKELMVKILN